MPSLLWKSGLISFQAHGHYTSEFLRQIKPPAFQRCEAHSVNKPAGSRSSPARENRISPTAMDRSSCGQDSDLERHSASEDTYIVGLCPKGGTL